ncbi:hypothetical protein ACWDOR_40000 [Streptosporangium canum]
MPVRLGRARPVSPSMTHSSSLPTPARSGAPVISDPTAIGSIFDFFAEQKIGDGRTHVTTVCRSAAQS